MAAKKGGKAIKRVSFVHLQKLTAGVSLIAFLVVIAAGIMGGARTITITYRACGVLLLIALVSRIIIRVLASYEEMNSGKG